MRSNRGERASSLDTNDDGNTFDPPHLEGASPVGPPLLPPPSPAGQAPLAPPSFTAPAFTPMEGPPTATVVPSESVGKRSKGKSRRWPDRCHRPPRSGRVRRQQDRRGRGRRWRCQPHRGRNTPDGFSRLGRRARRRRPVCCPASARPSASRSSISSTTSSVWRSSAAPQASTNVGGVDLAFDDVAVDTTETNVDDISNIHVTATGTASIDGDAVPIGDLLIDEAFGGDRPDLDDRAAELRHRLASDDRQARWPLVPQRLLLDRRGCARRWCTTSRRQASRRTVPTRPRAPCRTSSTPSTTSIFRR